MYEAGPREVRCPIVCLPPVCGTADVFFRQLLDLSAAGYRIISVGKARAYYFGNWISSKLGTVCSVKKKKDFENLNSHNFTGITHLKMYVPH